MNIENILNEISEKAQKLKLRSERLENENKDLRDSVFNYLNQLSLQKKEIETIQLQQKNSEKASSENFDKQKVQKEIDKYLLMVEKSISMLELKLD